MNTKRTLACAALLLGLLSFNAPLTAAVESDIVGYTRLSRIPNTAFSKSSAISRMAMRRNCGMAPAIRRSFITLKPPQGKRGSTMTMVR